MRGVKSYIPVGLLGMVPALIAARMAALPASEVKHAPDNGYANEYEMKADGEDPGESEMKSENPTENEKKSKRGTGPSGGGSKGEGHKDEYERKSNGEVPGEA